MLALQRGGAVMSPAVSNQGTWSRCRIVQATDPLLLPSQAKYVRLNRLRLPQPRCRRARTVPALWWWHIERCHTILVASR